MWNNSLAVRKTATANPTHSNSVRVEQNNGAACCSMRCVSSDVATEVTFANEDNSSLGALYNDADADHGGDDDDDVQPVQRNAN